ncbi:hypothetical protein [Hymenobacter metallilatus]|uniref:Uncharacterized protein n=1 Tax=Hymenobacter metallilatus TaxID=2493666 RepID=A0A3R9P7A2_9BACT|nr:hypothetical protein [Hymenobacter metallilatus]RSK29862.1 hypothetical protein EI290_16125 [Hymenobacter metallilatus]
MSYDLTDIYYVGTHRYSFRPGKPARIVGARRAHGHWCYVVRYSDGQRDLKLLRGAAHYRLVSGADIAAGRLPKVSE